MNKNQKQHALFITDFYPHKAHPSEGLCVKAMRNHVPDFIETTLIAPAIKYPPFRRYKLLRQRRPREFRQSKNTFRIPMYALPKSGERLTLFSYARAVEKWVRQSEIKFDFIHAHWIYRSGYIAAVLTEKYNLPLILSVWGSDIDRWILEKRKRKSSLIALQKADIILVQNFTHKQMLVDYHVSSSKIRVVPMGVDTRVFQPEFTMTEDDEQFRFLYVANFHKGKGHQLLLDAFAQLPGTAALHLIGDGPMRESLERQAQAQQLSVHFHGQMQPSKIPRLINTCDAFVIPSEHEGGPLVLLEALSCGKPVISTQVGFASEILHDQKLGILVPIDKVTSLAAALEIAMKTAWDADYIREQALRFDWSHFTECISEVYSSVLKVQR